ncbi:uncharacterized protein LAJ45_04338 [Morchella importuna]|uniref:uncharacterized protein n=1 Tax=Morchella importuna TaxID=1174673 RepID=UPI001E8CD713|nr:uncharacterized protein LAJ45_04338 [Morchella importuna]KAH8151716.1 hypothetical protein LAJ45_04338 [Morchella importuna]
MAATRADRWAEWQAGGTTTSSTSSSSAQHCNGSVDQGRVTQMGSEERGGLACWIHGLVRTGDQYHHWPRPRAAERHQPAATAACLPPRTQGDQPPETQYYSKALVRVVSSIDLPRLKQHFRLTAYVVSRNNNNKHRQKSRKHYTPH